MKSSIKSKEFDQFDFEFSELVCIRVFIEGLKSRNVKTSKREKNKILKEWTILNKKEKIFSDKLEKYY